MSVPQERSLRRIAGLAGRTSLSALREAAPVPDFLVPLRAQLAQLLSPDDQLFEQALITEYRPGAPLGWHRDAISATREHRWSITFRTLRKSSLDR